MITSTMAEFVSIFVIIATSIYRMLNDIKNDWKQLFWNIFWGSILFSALNLLGLSINLNIVSASLIVLLGVPGIVLTVLLKLLFVIF